MPRRPGQPSKDYGADANDNRPRAKSLAITEIRERLAVNHLAANRLRSILGSGCSAEDPLVYEVRAPYGTIPLVKWGLVEVKTVGDRIHVWPLPLAHVIDAESR